MRIFINDIFLRIESADNLAGFTGFLTREDSMGITTENLKGRCLLRETRPEDLKKILNWILQDKLPLLEDLVCMSQNHEKLKNLVKDEFRIIKAAGGLVRKNGKFLLIHRLGKWDLPKGKLEKNEKMKEAALREVEEECNIKAARREKICNTWHSYKLDGKRILKKTAWYVMDCLDDRKMRPQEEEDIDAISWMSAEDALKALRVSYRSIQEVFRVFLDREMENQTKSSHSQL